MLENGTTDTRPGLVTFPQNVLNGYIQGIYPTYTVQSGDHFQATINCQFGATECFVIFRVDAEMAGGVTQNIATFAERYDGLYNPVDFDLSSLAGKSVNWILTVQANGSPTGDRALWVAPRIVHSVAVGGASLPATVATDTPVVIVTNTPMPVSPDTATPLPSDSPTPTGTPQ